MARPKPNAWIGVANQAPLTSATGVFPLRQMLASRPSALFHDGAAVQPGDPAPPFALERTDGAQVALDDLGGTPVLLRLTRAVTGRVI